MGETPVIYQQLKYKLKVHLDEWLTNHHGANRASPNGVDRELMERELRVTLLQQTTGRTNPHQSGLTLSPQEQEQLVQEVLGEMIELIGFGPLDALLADPTITEIMVNGPNEIFVERLGRIARGPGSFRDTEHLMRVIERMLASMNLAVNETNPICDASLSDGTRINVIIPPLVLNGPALTIRRKLPHWTVERYVEHRALTPRIVEFLAACVAAKVNIVISGGTSTGKTTLVSILSTFFPPQERIITIENVPELELPDREHWVRLVAKPSNIEGRGEIPLRALVKNALRMRPDRIILGEARGAEALDVVQAMHTGHDGFLTVMHANNPQAALERLETLMLMSEVDLSPSACRTQIASAVELIVHLTRSLEGWRGITSITQVLGLSAEGFQLEELFTCEADASHAAQVPGEALRYTGVRPRFLRKFQLNKIPIPEWISGQ